MIQKYDRTLEGMPIQCFSKNGKPDQLNQHAATGLLNYSTRELYIAHDQLKTLYCMSDCVPLGVYLGNLALLISGNP